MFVYFYSNLIKNIFILIQTYHIVILVLPVTKYTAGLDV